ncbi:HAD-IC family P-type ATPase [Aliikangiella marina]|uniref:HAD-IC family P-type ATPase n=1 Tax=Aliikangiella marina TaxID=1712262 RepID=A0A545TIT1_9GAMM|nr:HAD-IC family P-type ATPase [Aliikangiella marina]TQV77118.1 HAD-IC family P-type ATPase [Aliikangiella marina]
MPLKETITGLDSRLVTLKLAEFGENCLPESPPPALLILFLRQFKSPFIYVLLIAAIISFALGKNLNGIFIFAVLLINAIIGSLQEFSAEKAANALKKMVPQLSTVIRDGHTQSIDSTLIVPGDIVLLASGDRVPADGICIQAQQLLIDESLLTGESAEVSKQVAEAFEESQITDFENNQKCFAGTLVARGRGIIVVTHTGINTEIGKIAKAVNTSESVKPPLLTRIEKFTYNVTIATLIVVAFIFLIAMLRGDSLTQFFFLGVALAVSAIPEGLPAAITIALAIGMRRMAKVNVIVRNLMAVESLGSCTYIASDKTGTLTVNDMTVSRVILPNARTLSVTGEGLNLHGDIIGEQGEQDQQQLKRLCMTGALANEAELYLAEGNLIGEGDQVDIALLVLLNKYGIEHRVLQQRHPEIMKIPYESENAFSASLNRLDGRFLLSVKGSWETIKTQCDSQDDEQLLAEIEQQVLTLAEKGYRVLAFAGKEIQTLPHQVEDELSGLEFIGLVGIIDPLRHEVFDAVKACKSARIEVAMITGDHPATALEIARQVKIEGNGNVLTGEQIRDLKSNNPQAFAKAVSETSVFARVKPLEKQCIVEELQRQGHYVAVTGDGVNDAPALKNSHVGIAMGKRGTDVARESADLILTDDNFSSIVNGIREGRVVYANIRKVIFLLISTGAAEIILFILSLLAGLPLPLFPIQLLWLNLVTNGVQDVALAFEPAEGKELNNPPRKPNEPIFNRLMLERVIVNAIVMGGVAFALFYLCLSQGIQETSARNMTLLLMVLFENVHALNSRSESQSIFSIPFLSNKLLLLGILIAQSLHIGAMYLDGLSGILEVEPVTLQQWFYLLLTATTLILVDTAYKKFKQR